MRYVLYWIARYISLLFAAIYTGWESPYRVDFDPSERPWRKG